MTVMLSRPPDSLAARTKASVTGRGPAPAATVAAQEIVAPRAAPGSALCRRLATAGTRSAAWNHSQADNHAGSGRDNLNVLAVGAYPSEIVLLCGGTLAKYSLAGHLVAIAALCRVGTRHPEYTQEMAEADAREFQNAAAVISASTYDLQLPQFDLRDDYETKLKVAEIIRQVQPMLIITHDRNEYAHDHRTTNEIVTDSMFMSKQQGIKTGSPAMEQHPDVAFMDTVAGIAFDPEQYVDITKVIEVKRRMMMAFAREIEEFKDNPVVETLELMEITARYRGIQSGYRYAEAFRWPHRWGFAPGQPMLI